MEGPRLMKKSEMDETMDLMIRAFHMSDPQWFQNNSPLYYSEGATAAKFHYVIREKGRIVAHTAIYPLRMVVGTQSFWIGGIGGVCTDSGCRGKGFMSRLLLFCIEKMKKDGYPLSVLWGDRYRYGHYGWEVAGEEATFRISGRGLREQGVQPGKIRLYQEEADALETVHRLYSQLLVRVDRSVDDMSRILRKKGIETWMTDRSYVVLTRKEQTGTVLECAGEPGSLLSLLMGIVRAFGLNELLVRTVRHDCELNRALQSVSSGWSCAPSVAIKILDLRGTLNVFREEVEERRRRAGLGEFSPLKMSIPESRQEAGLFGGRRTAFAQGVKVVLKETDMVRFLFDGMPSSRCGCAHPFVSVLPLPFRVPALNHI